jgi:hypothetical protein
MNRFMEEQWPMFEGTHGMRAELLGTLSDADLAFNPGGQNMTLGALFREMGEIEHSYTQSFKTLKQDFNYRNTDPDLDSSTGKIKAWYDKLDGEMKATLAAFSDDDMKKTIDRGGFSPSVETQLQIYLQALLIFFGKATIYVKMMNKALPKTFQDYIG